MNIFGIIRIQEFINLFLRRQIAVKQKIRHHFWQFRVGFKKSGGSVREQAPNFVHIMKHEA
jgi:hypothetical protein